MLSVDWKLFLVVALYGAVEVLRTKCVSAERVPYFLDYIYILLHWQGNQEEPTHSLMYAVRWIIPHRTGLPLLCIISWSMLLNCCQDHYLRAVRSHQCNENRIAICLDNSQFHNGFNNYTYYTSELMHSKRAEYSLISKVSASIVYRP